MRAADAALRGKMREHKLDAIIVPGDRATGASAAACCFHRHWEWHALCCYVLVPHGEPPIYSWAARTPRRCAAGSGAVQTCATAATDVTLTSWSSLRAEA
jgi:hypothetical protein